MALGTMALKYGKKGIFFTMISILLLGIVIYSFVVLTYSLTNKSLVIQTRVATMDDFMKDIESDLNRGLYISTFRSILGMEQYVIDNGTFLTNAEEQFQSAFYNGSINGVYLIITEDNLFSDWIFKIWESGHSRGIDVNITVNSVVLYQDSPWEVGANLDSTIIIEDIKGTSRWQKQKTFNTKIPITGLEDVLYTKHFEMKTSNLIQRSPYEGNYAPGGDVTNLLSHLAGSGEAFLAGSYYAQSLDGPGFLDRLEGRTSIYRAGTGIESFVNRDKIASFLSAADADYYYLSGRSSLDYVQFSGSNPQNYTIIGMPGWFRLDNTSDNLGKYNVSDIAIG